MSFGLWVLAAGAAAVPDTVKAKSGLPQLNVADFAPQLIWLALTFGLLYLIMSRVALPRIGEVIEERSQRIQRDLDEAERLKGETEKALGAYEQALAEARAKAQGIAKETRDKLVQWRLGWGKERKRPEGWRGPKEGMLELARQAGIKDYCLIKEPSVGWWLEFRK